MKALPRRDSAASSRRRGRSTSISPEQDGYRAGVAIYEIKDSSKFCAIAEPWFLTFNAECRFSFAMTPEDLGKVGLEELGKKWA